MELDHSGSKKPSGSTFPSFRNSSLISRSFRINSPDTDLQENPGSKRPNVPCLCPDCMLSPSFPFDKFKAINPLGGLSNAE